MRGTSVGLLNFFYRPMFHRGLPIMKGSSVGFEAELEVRLQQVNSTTRLSTQPARPVLRFRACQIRVRRKLARGERTFA